jgi:hypothetical protein
LNLVDGVRGTEQGVNEERERREEWRRRKMRAELLIRSVIALRNAGKYRYIDIDIYAMHLMSKLNSLLTTKPKQCKSGR